ncbi:MAG: xanthine phosphoribosyltransferase [Trueperaceae bacterium]|nr:xanthine phosphoribosyltransferase [Trueperaceae bacterium]
MKSLKERILSEGKYLGNGILKVDGFLNHQLYPDLTMQMGREFCKRLSQHGVSGVTKIVTAETSGIAPALAAAVAFDAPLVFARKKRPITMPDGYFSSEAPSHTKGGITTLMISPEYLRADDQVVIIDDFLATGLTTKALIEAIQKSGARVLGIGAVIEKGFEGGRTVLESFGVPIVSLAVIERLDESGIYLRD